MEFLGDRMCGVFIQTNIGELGVFSSYIRPTTGEGLDQLSHGLDRAIGRTRHRLVGMDSNGHSPLWGPKFVKQDQLGRRVEDALAEGNMLVLNHSDSPPTFHGDWGQPTWIDVTAASPSVASRATSWSVRTSIEVASDHYLLQTVLDLEPHKFRVRRIPDWVRTDWRAFSRVLQGSLGLLPEGSLDSAEDIDCCVMHMTKSIQRTITLVTPTKRVCAFSRPWWHSGLTVLRGTMYHWRRRWVRTGRVYDRERFLEARRAFRGEVATAKRDSWHHLCTESTQADLWSLYRRLSQPRAHDDVDTLAIDSEVVSTDAGKAAALAPIFFPSLPPSTDSRQAAIDFAWGTHRPPGDRDSVEVSLGEVRDAVKAMPLTSTPGLDHIPVVVLRKNLFILAPWLRLIYSSSLSLQYFPRTWRVAKVIVLRKPGKATYSTPRSYRPISLLSHLGKGLERIVNRRLMHDLESRQVLSPYQFGFRAGRHTVAACHRLTEAIYAAFRRMHQIQAVTLDIQSAYDTVWRAGLVRKLAEAGVEGYLVRWTQSFLTDRIAMLEVGEHTREVLTSCGVPQGSPLSPTLFLVFIDDLIHSLSCLGPLKAQGFADDLVLWIEGSFRAGDIHPILRQGLLRAEQWSRFWRIRFSPGKCECITFCGKTVSVAHRFQAFMYGELLPHQPALKYLGVWFDEHMTWQIHVSEAIRKARARLWALHRGIGLGWGVHPLLFLRLVKGVIVPLLFYAAPCWAAVLGVETRLIELDRVMALASRMAFGLERSTSIEASLALGGLGPARTHITRALVRYLCRCQRTELYRSPSLYVHRSYVTPVELGKAWLRREVLRSTAIDLEHTRWRVIRESIDVALVAEWQRRWRSANTGRTLFVLLDQAGEPWMPVDASFCGRMEMVLVARYMTGHCHLGPFAIPREDELEDCPLCGELYLEDHFIFDCVALRDVRVRWLDVGGRGIGNLRGLVWQRCSRLGTFLRVVRERLIASEDS